ncbi:MAG: glyoxalase/bleomycin resistance/dioxygenase family protein [Henriciella sp.]|nr:glyoxalase/bleomycin resistance/dioxygenase family protein [Henriciella sp.]
MKRLHIHISAADMAQTKAFYSALFGQAPSVEKPDYMKWMLDDPRINLAVSQRDGAVRGVDHVGIQVDSDAELEDLNAALQAAEQSTLAEPDANCCYAHSNKHWAKDPQGVVWEMFHSMETIPTYGHDLRDSAAFKEWTPEENVKARECCG